MTAGRSRELEQLEDNTSSSPSFTFGDIIRMWVQLGEHFAARNPEEPLNDPILVCVRQALIDAGHVEPLPEEAHSHGEGDDAGDARFWDHVSPATTFLAEHLPPFLPSPAHEAGGAGAGPSTSTPQQRRLIYDFGALASPSGADTPTDQVTRSVQAPDSIICPLHGPVLAYCPTHGLTTVRRGPLEPTLNFAGLSLGEGSSTGVTRSVADTESLGSFTASLNSLNTSPEHIAVPLPNVDAAAAAGFYPAAVAAPAVAAPAVVIQPPPAIAAPVPAAQPAPVPGAQPAPAPADGPAYVAHIANDGADTYYVVTRGRTVGVFDSWAMMVASVSRVSGGSGRGGFHSRDAAIAAFRAAEALGIVVQRDD